jgi:nucleotide-binding universal stress UspA family protein
MATDLGEASEAAARVATSLARGQNASLSFLHVYVLPTTVYGAYPMLVSAVPSDEVQKAAEGALAEWMRRFEGPAAHKSLVRPGDPADTILEEIKSSNADLLVVGTHGRRGVSRVFLGSTAEKLVRLSPIPVLTIREQAKE